MTLNEAARELIGDGADATMVTVNPDGSPQVSLVWVALRSTPDGDELVHVIDGAATLQIATESESRSFAVSAGMLAIVPKGVWHRFHYPDGVTLLTVTPGQSEYVRADIEDPLSVEPQRD